MTASERILSVTKSFAATAILQLVGEARIFLDDMSGGWLSGLSRGDVWITLRKLLDGRSLRDEKRVNAAAAALASTAREVLKFCDELLGEDGCSAGLGWRRCCRALPIAKPEARAREPAHCVHHPDVVVVGTTARIVAVRNLRPARRKVAIDLRSRAAGHASRGAA